MALIGISPGQMLSVEQNENIFAFPSMNKNCKPKKPEQKSWMQSKWLVGDQEDECYVNKREKNFSYITGGKFCWS